MDKYEIGRTLGRGQWGVVRKARRKTDGLELAIKRIRFGGSKEGINFQVLREVKMLRNVRHTQIVALHDVCILRDSHRMFRGAGISKRPRGFDIEPSVRADGK